MPAPRKSSAKAGIKTTSKRGSVAQSTPDGRALIASLTPALQAKLAKLGLHSDIDLALHLPLRYIDETHIYPIADVPFGQMAQVEAVVVKTEVRFRPRRQLVSLLEDASGAFHIRLLHFYPSQQKVLCEGARLRVLGEMRMGFFGPEMVHPQMQKVTDDAALKQSLTPVYPTTAGLGQAQLRKLIARALAHLELSETLPDSARVGLAAFSDSLRFLHEPPPDAPLAELETRAHWAWQRLIFDELLAQQLSMRQHYARRRQLRAPQLKAKQTLSARLLASLPFSLTGAQQAAWREISQDLAAAHPMQRLLQGDVGSGKTVIAALACAQVLENNFQAAVMAPTEILAEQHFLKLHAWFAPLGVQVVWLAASVPKRSRAALLADIDNGSAQLIVGTHALFQAEVNFARLGLAVVDEQHRFGVEQRLALHNKGVDAEQWPHQLMMSATPIPRTLSMSYFADLDVSVIAELPPGRTPIVTKLVEDARRDDVMERVRAACLAGRQVYWVCPLIEETTASGMSAKNSSDVSDTLFESAEYGPAISKPGAVAKPAQARSKEARELQTVLATHAYLSDLFPELTVGLVHGRLKAQDKAATMAAFKSGQIQLLVATTVIEVGVDVANASLMVIDHAERMGLAQLHQLRGRVGRGAAQSACILLYSPPLSALAKARLKIIFELSDGFEIARQDLLLRGPGEFLGARQSGLPMLKIADLERDLEHLETAQQVAAKLLKEDTAAVERHLARWLARAEQFLKV